MPNAPLLGVSDVMSGGHDPADGRHIDHTPKCLAGMVIGAVVFIYFFDRSGLRVVIGVGGRA